MKEVKIPQTIITLIIGIAIWFIPAPNGVVIEAWHLFAIFVATILGIILKAAPMGTMCMIAIALTAFTQVLAPGDPGKSITLALKGSKIKSIIPVSSATCQTFSQVIPPFTLL